MKHNSDKKLFRDRVFGLVRILVLLALVIIGGSVYAKDRTAYLADQQAKEITGTVKDELGNPLVSVSIVEKGTINGTLTNENGSYKINASSDNAVLEFRYVGFSTQEVGVKGKSIINIILKENIESLQEVVVIAYGAQKRESITGAISSVTAEDLKKSSSPNLAAALAGRISGLASLQSKGGQPGMDDAALYLRGRGTLNNSSPLILIDGVPRDNIRSIDPNEVESISILKDASATAVFGVRGANGALLITTKRGKEGKAELSITAEQSFTSFTRMPKRLHSLDYFKLRQEALANDGLTDPDITTELIKKYENPLIGLDPNAPDYAAQAAIRKYMYPDHDYYNDHIRKHTPQTRINANMSGGSKKLSYFTNIGYLYQGSNFNTEKKSKLGYDPEMRMDRWSFRSNLDYKISNNLKVFLNIGTYIEKVNMPYVGPLYGGSIDWMVTDILYQTQTILPITPGPLVLPGYGIEGGQLIQPRYLDRTAHEILNRRGYRNEAKTNLNSTLGAEWDLGSVITPGLSVKGMVSYDSFANTVLEGGKSERLYYTNINEQTNELSYSEFRSTESLLSLARSSGSRYTVNLQGSVNYTRMFNKKHDVGAMILAQRDYWESGGADFPFNMLGLVGRATYSFDTRYFLEVNMGYNGSEQFNKNERFGFFPAASIGWVPTNESFFPKNKILTYLKIRSSYGKVGNDKMGGDRFLYVDKISMTGGVLGSLGRGQAVNEGLLGNYGLTWEIAKKLNVGIDFQITNDLKGSFDWFTENRTQILTQRRSVPAFQGVLLRNIPKANIAEVDNKGYEFELTYNKAITKDLSISIKGNISGNKNKVIFADEPIRDETYVHRYRTTGYSIGQPFGYEINWGKGGYWASEEDIANSKLKYDFGEPRPGDFIYIDQNEDGVIDSRDEVPLKYTAIPRINYGINFGAEYSGFDFSIFFQGVSKFSGYFGDTGVFEYIKQGTYWNYTRNAWTKERWDNGEKITYPALGSGNNTNHVPNSFFVQDRSFIRLKNIELGYTLPSDALKVVGVSKLRVYVSGQNLVTWDKMVIDHQDPEKNHPLQYPITKMMNFGLNITF